MTATDFALASPRSKTDLELLRFLAAPTLKELPPLAQLARMSEGELRDFGMTTLQAAKVAHAIELARRVCQASSEPRKVVSSSGDAFQLLRHLKFENEECFNVIFLDRRSKVISIEEIHRGGMAAMVVDPKVIFRKALSHRAHAVILCHNHPSGNPAPSMEDIRLTEKARSGGSLLDIQVLDHVIIGDDRYYSFADEGKM